MKCKVQKKKKVASALHSCAASLSVGDPQRQYSSLDLGGQPQLRLALGSSEEGLHIRLRLAVSGYDCLRKKEKEKIQVHLTQRERVEFGNGLAHPSADQPEPPSCQPEFRTRKLDCWQTSLLRPSPL